MGWEVVECLAWMLSVVNNLTCSVHQSWNGCCNMERGVFPVSFLTCLQTLLYCLLVQF